MLNSIRSGLADFVDGVSRHRLWLTLAVEDISDAQKNTIFGPFWVTINYLVMVTTFIVIFGTSADPAFNFAIYLAMGFLVWSYINDTISQGAGLFKADAGLIKGTTLPLTVYAMRLTARSTFRICFSLLGTVIIVALSSPQVTLGWLWAIPGICLILLTGPPVALIFAFLGARIPDTQFFISNVMRVMMFITPVFWNGRGQVDSLRSALYHYNPFTHFLEIVRDPLMNLPVPVTSYLVCGSITLVFWAMAIVILGRFRRAVPFLV